VPIAIGVSAVNVNLAECRIGLLQVSLAQTLESAATGSARATHDGPGTGADFHHEWERIRILLVFMRRGPVVPTVIARTQGLHLLRQSPNIPRRSYPPQPRTRRHTNRQSPLLHPRSEIIILVPIKRIRIRAPQRKLTTLAILDAEILPVEQRREALDAIALVDALPARLGAEAEHVRCELVDGVFDGLGAPVDDVAAFVFGSLDEVLHEAAEAGEVGGYAGDAHNSTFGGCVSPGFVVTREDAEMCSSDKLFIVEAQDGIVRIEKVGMEYDLDAVATIIEQSDPPYLVQYGIIRVVGHVMRRDGRERISFEGKDAAFEENEVFV